MKQIAKALSLLLIAAALLAGCAGGGETPSGQTSLTDFAGRTVAVGASPKKIVAMVPSDVEILYALGAQDSLIAVGEYCNYPPEAAEKASVGTGENTSVEQLIALAPDLILLGKMAQQVEHCDALEAAGMTVYISEAQTIEDTYRVISDIGTLLGKKTEAEELVSSMQQGFSELGEQAKGKEPRTAYVEISPLAFGLYTCGSGTFIHELLAIVGAENAFGDQEGWVPLSEEQVIARNPDVILTTSLESYGLGVPAEEIAARPGWDVLSAVQSGNVKQIDSDASTRPGPRLLDAAREIFAAIYGQ